MSDKKARDVMSSDCTCVGENDSVLDAAKRLAEKDVGSLPICGEDDKLSGILTDRDIVTKCIATGHDPAMMTAGELADGTLLWVDARTDEDEILTLMESNGIRRVPVIEEHMLIGMISEADLAQHLSEDKLAHFVSAITNAPPSLGQQTR